MNPIHTHTTLKLTRRMRRLRRTEAMRALVRETRLSPDAFMLPLFVCDGEGVRREVPSMPGVYNLSVDEKTSIQALDRTQPLLPLKHRPVRIDRPTSELLDEERAERDL